MKKIAEWWHTLGAAFAAEWQVIRHDAGALLFFLLLPLFYPVVYTLVYNPELVRDLPVAVVDHSRTQSSRHLSRMIDATETMKVAYYPSNMQEARQLFYANDAMVIVEIPSDYATRLGRGEQAVVSVFCQMPLLLRFRQVSGAVTNLQMALAQELTGTRLSMTGIGALLGEGPSGSVIPINTVEHQIGDPQQGFASFVMPGIVVLILQQSMLLGICLLAGTRNERRRWPKRSQGAVICGRGLCYTLLMAAPALWLLHYVPVIFSLPHYGVAWQWILLIVPLLIATAMLGQMIGRLMHQREDAFLWLVVTSVIFLFLSGLTWPIFAMPRFLQALGAAVPATWGINAFIRINGDTATLAQNAGPYLWLWGLAVAYFIGAYLVAKVKH